MVIHFEMLFHCCCITYVATEAADIEAVYQYAVALMGGNVARLMDKLEVQGNVPKSFPVFKKLFINQYTPLGDKNIAKDKLHKL